MRNFSDSWPVIGFEQVTNELQASSEYLDLQQLINGGRVLKTRTE